MACWFPSNTVESWFPQIRINRLAAEAAAANATVATKVRKPAKAKAVEIELDTTSESD